MCIVNPGLLAIKILHSMMPFEFKLNKQILLSKQKHNNNLF